jgi:hypothetical protein
MFTQKQKQLQAHERITVHEIFGHTMNFLEKYIEIAEYYPDWEQKKQIWNNEITRTDILGNPEKAEKAFSVVLFGLRQALEENPSPSLRDELKQEFYRWISSTGINANNCPPRLKQILFGFNEILEGRGEKIMEDVINRKETTDINAPDYAERLNNIFAGAQPYLAKGREREELLKGKKGHEVEIANRFGGSSEQGEKIFGKISQTVSSHDDFHYFKQKDSNPQRIEEEIDEFQQNRRNTIRNIKQDINDWSFEKVLVFNGHLYDWNKKEWIRYDNEKEEVILVHKSVAGLEKKYNQFGVLEVHHGKMFDKQTLGEQGWSEIEQAKSRSEKTRHQTQTATREGGRGGGKGGFGNPFIWTSGVVISLIGLAFVK